MAGGFGFIAAAGSLRSWCFAESATWCGPARPLRNRWLRAAPAHIYNAALQCRDTTDGRTARPGRISIRESPARFATLAWPRVI